MKAPCEGPTGEFIIRQCRNMMEYAYLNNEALLKERGTSRAKQWEWLKDHGITYSERSYMYWNPNTKNKRIGSVNIMVIAALATYHNVPIERFIHGKMKE